MAIGCGSATHRRDIAMGTKSCRCLVARDKGGGAVCANTVSNALLSSSSGFCTVYAISYLASGGSARGGTNSGHS